MDQNVELIVIGLLALLLSIIAGKIIFIKIPANKLRRRNRRLKD